jgi:hypothetical protein
VRGYNSIEISSAKVSGMKMLAASFMIMKISTSANSVSDNLA